MSKSPKIQKDVGIFLTDAETCIARDTIGLYKDHRAFVIAEFRKQGFLIKDFAGLRFSLRTVVVHGKKVDGFYVQGVLGKDVVKVHE